MEFNATLFNEIEFSEDNDTSAEFENSTLCATDNCTNSSQQELDMSLVEFQEQSRFWIQRVLVPFIMIIGVIGNTMTIFIMTQRRMRSSTNWYLAALAIFDMSYLVFSFVLSFQHYPHIHDSQFYAYWKLWPYLLTITDSSSNSSVWLTVTFTVERYIAVCHPMKGKVLCTESRAKKMIVIVFFFSFVISLPTAFEWNIVEVVKDNSTRVFAVESQLALNPVYVSVYYWAVAVIFVVIPIILLAVFNAFLIRSVHSSKTARKTMTRRKETGDQARQESKITVMLIAVVILFLVCQLPTAVTLMYRSFHHVVEGTNEDYLLRGLGNIFNFLVAVNAAGNFVLYCLLSQKYRRTLLMIFCPCLRGRMGRIHSAYQATNTTTTVYTAIDNNESPHAARKLSIGRTQDKVVRTQDKVGFARPKQTSLKQASTATQKLSFSNQVAVFEDPKDPYPPERDVGNRRVLRGFRCPWKRQKVATDSMDDDRTGQFIPLKSPTKNPYDTNTLTVEP